MGINSLDLKLLISKLKSVLNDSDNLLLYKLGTKERKEVEAILNASLQELSLKDQDLNSLREENRLLKREIENQKTNLSLERTKKANRSVWESKLFNLLLRSKNLLNLVIYGGVTALSNQDREKMRTWFKDANEALSESEKSLRGPYG